MKPTMSFQDWCIQNHAYLLLHFYHEGKNPIPPDEIGFSSGKYARFRCHVCGLSWQRTLNHITNHPLVQTCPFCEHRKPSPFYNLATEYPELKEEWDNEKNLFPPETCLPHSNRSVYWRCAKNHRWKAVICDRTETADKARKSGFQVCPYCSKERISATYNLTTEYPEVSKEWNYIKNKGQKPEDGGTVNADTHGKPRSANGSAGMDARIAQDTGQAKNTACRPAILLLPPSGILKKMKMLHRGM